MAHTTFSNLTLSRYDGCIITHILHGLMTKWRKVDDGKTTLGETDSLIRMEQDASIVRPAEKEVHSV